MSESNRVTVEIVLLKDQLEKYRTNHILHIILSVLTGGLWIGMWLFLTFHNSTMRDDVRRRIENLYPRGGG